MIVLESVRILLETDYWEGIPVWLDISILNELLLLNINWKLKFQFWLIKHWCLQAIEKDGAVVQALRSRRQVILDNIRDNDEAGTNYQKVIAFIFMFANLHCLSIDY